MAYPLIIFYGSTGLESQVFQSYMMSSGYQVQIVHTRESAISALRTDPAAISVIALEKQQQELLDQAQALRAHADQARAHFFILSTEDSLPPRQTWVDVIPRPYRLSELVRRIQALQKDFKKSVPDSSALGTGTPNAKPG